MSGKFKIATIGAADRYDRALQSGATPADAWHMAYDSLKSPSLRASLSWAARSKLRALDVGLQVHEDEKFYTITTISGEVVATHHSKPKKWHKYFKIAVSNAVAFGTSYGLGRSAVKNALSGLKDLAKLNWKMGLAKLTYSGASYKWGASLIAYGISRLTGVPVYGSAIWGMRLGSVVTLGEIVGEPLVYGAREFFNPGWDMGGEAGRAGSYLNDSVRRQLSGSGESWTLYEL